jgi:hypothetical protein
MTTPLAIACKSLLHCFESSGIEKLDIVRKFSHEKSEVSTSA